MSVIESIPEKAIVAFVTIFITFLQFTTNFYILGPVLGGWMSPFALKISSPMNVLLISIYINYYLACTTDPGSTPEGWEPPYAILNPDDSIPLRIGSTGPRFCKKCDSYKPPRSHHCRHCGKCVLRMDHHCPWIGNCVGFGNYAHFVRFVFSVIGCCSYGGYLLLWRLQRIIDMRKSVWFAPRPSTMELVVVVVNLLMIAIVILLVGVLAVYHSYCLFKGQTTIEGWERTKTTRLIRRKKIDPVDFPFDLGFYRNMCSVLGNNPLVWWWPSSSPGNGLSYPVKPNTDPASPYSWPPRDPKDLGATIIERVEKEHIWDGPKLVRRDSEGYLVKEITMEDRMKMLYAENMERENEQMEDSNQSQQEYDPEAYYYDSDSVNSDLTDINDDDNMANGPVTSEPTNGYADEEEEWVDE